jgi:hypothetical protein
MWCGDGLFFGAQKHATDFNFIFSVARGCEAALRQASGVSEWESVVGVLIVNDSPDLETSPTSCIPVLG